MRVEAHDRRGDEWRTCGRFAWPAVVLSVAKVKKIEYYLDYVRAGGEPGQWWGRGIAGLGLAGEVAPEPFLNLGGGRAPGGGRLIPRISKSRVAGWDLTFSAPKSVSLLYALGDEKLAGAARAAHDTAVNAAMRYLEREAGRARRGFGGRDGQVAAGLVVGRFTHKTSREQDPQLHTHCVTLNVGLGEDGRWTTIDSRPLYRHRMAAGYLYQALIRAELARQLGVEWRPVHKGQAEIAGIDPVVLRGFSRRRQQIERRLNERGQHSAQAADVATLDTRRTKVYVEFEELRPEWTERGRALGVTAQTLGTLTGRSGGKDLSKQDVAQGGFEMLSGVGPKSLTYSEASFTRREVIRAWCERHGQGASVATIEALADATLADSRAVPLVAEHEGRREVRYSTTGMLAVEAEVLDSAARRRRSGAGLVERDLVEAAIARRPTMRPEQAEMVRRLCLDGDGVAVVVGAPGTGKTFSLDATREAWQAAGYRVIGGSLAAEAAKGLAEGAHIDSSTVARLLFDLERDPARLGPNTALVLDEAAMIDTRSLARFARWAERTGAKLVLVGDHRQLAEIEAGGAFGGLVGRLDPITLVDNRRQRQQWERDAVRDLREGRTDMAMEAYVTNGRVTVADSPSAARAALVADWWQVVAGGGGDPARKPALMWAYTRSATADLNAMGRAYMAEAGRLVGPELDIGGRVFQAGDKVVCMRGQRRLGVANDPSGRGVTNGTRGRVTSVGPYNKTLRMLTTDGRTVGIPRAYLAKGWVDHGYAMTITKGQGKTVGDGFILGDGLAAEAALTAMSRGENQNRLYLSDTAEPTPESHGQPAKRDALADTVAEWQRSASKSLAVDELAQANHVRDLARSRTTPELLALRVNIERRLTPPPEVERELVDARRQLAAARDAVTGARSRVTATTERVEASRARLHGRLGRDDLNHANAALRHALEKLDLVGVALEPAQARLAAVEHRAALRAEWLRNNSSDLGQVAAIDRALALRRAWRSTAIAADPPAYVTDLLGAVPDARAARLRWQQTATRIDDHRQRHPGPVLLAAESSEASPLERAIGCRPDRGDPLGQREWEHTRKAIDSFEGGRMAGRAATLEPAADRL